MITREDLVTQSVTDYVRTAIFDEHGYPETQVEILDAWPSEIKTLERNLITQGFNFDDEGEQAEMGSALKKRLYTVQFIVFGITETYAKNLANVIKFAIDKEPIPLKDYNEPDAPVIDVLELEGVSAERQRMGPDPEPWQEHVWTTTAQVRDYYNARL